MSGTVGHVSAMAYRQPVPLVDAGTAAALRDGAAVVIATLAFLAGAAAFVFGRVDAGLELGRDDQGAIVIGAVGREGWASRSGLEPGMRVVEINGEPAAVYQGHPEIERTAIFSLVAELPGAEYSVDIGYANVALQESSSALVFGSLVLVASAWWLRRRHVTGPLREQAIPFAAATAVPLLVVPALLTYSSDGMFGSWVLAALGPLPLALGLTGYVRHSGRRTWLALAVTGAALLAVLLGFLLFTGGATEISRRFRWEILAASPLLAGLGAAAACYWADAGSGSWQAPSVTRAVELAVGGVTPAVALLTLVLADSGTAYVPLLLWIALLLVARRFTIQPLLRVAQRAVVQRDLIVAASEAERARLAADLHDDALQELTMLVRRLDAAGDDEGAAMARTVADRLRQICGDLRLPILDDLGAGAALEWLVERIERLAGGEVRLERADVSRPPSQVELAVFRVAQEALSNAVRHGRPPIVVRYRASDSGVSLSVDDAGPGIPADADETATRAGHFGLLNMRQRAEQIGAILAVRRWPGGGTHVALEWRAR